MGVSDHAGWAALMTVDSAGAVVDRRRVELVDPSRPSFVYHQGAQGLPIDEGLALVERVAAAAGLAALADALEGEEAIGVIPLHVHRTMQESELVLGDGLLCQGKPVSAGSRSRRRAPRCSSATRTSRGRAGVSPTTARPPS